MSVVQKSDRDLEALLQAASSKEEKLRLIMAHLHEEHVRVAIDGCSFVGVIDLPNDRIRVIHSASVETLQMYIAEREETDGPFLTVQIAEMRTRH